MAARLSGLVKAFGVLRVAPRVAESTRAFSGTSAACKGLDELIVTVPEHAPPRAGRAWLAAELRSKSWDDLHALWIVLLKERTRLHAERAVYRAQKLQQPDVGRYRSVRLSMNRIKQVMSERAIAEHSHDPATFKKLKAFIKSL